MPMDRTTRTRMPNEPDRNGSCIEYRNTLSGQRLSCVSWTLAHPVGSGRIDVIWSV
jgi:hypothetical protein